MDLGAGFLTKLEPFLLMSKSAKGAAAAKLILDATGSPGVFVFGELLDVPSIQEVRVRSCEPGEGADRTLPTQLSRNEQYVGHYRLLQLFAYGTYDDYLSASNLPRHRIPHLNFTPRGEGDLPSTECRSDHETQASDPCLPRYGAKGKHDHRISLAILRRYLHTDSTL